MDKYLIKYLVENAETALSKKYIDFFKAELDWQIYVSETHMSKQYFRNKEISLKERLLRFYQYNYALFIQSTLKPSKKFKGIINRVFPFKGNTS